MTSKKNWVKQLQYIPYALRLVWAAAKIWTTAWITLMVIQSVLPVLSVYLIRELVNQGTTLIRAGWDSPILQSVVEIAVLLALVQIAIQIISSVIEWVRSNQAEIVRDHISDLIQQKATSLDISFFDTPEYYDLLHRVRTDARQKPLTLLENLGGLATSSLTLLGMLAILATYSLWLPPILVVSTLPALWVVVRYSRQFNRWRLENTSNERRSLYYDFLLTERNAAAEVRLFSLSSYYRQAYQLLRGKLRHDRLKMNTDKLLTDLFATTIALLVGGGTLVWMGWRVVQGVFSLGDLAAFYQIFQQGQTLTQGLMQNAGNIYQSVLFLQDLHDFFTLTPQLPVSDKAPEVRIPLRHEIRFENISFRYPGSKSFALKNFSMRIPAGQIVAIVGENGVGKTTLTKLLCRFYDPQEGRILWDGTDIRDLPLEALQREITMLFQLPYSYPESVHQNIAVGDIAAELNT